MTPQGLDDSPFLISNHKPPVASLAVLFGARSGWWAVAWPGNQGVSSLVPGLPLSSSTTGPCPLGHCFFHLTSTGEPGVPYSGHRAQPCVGQGPMSGSVLIKTYGLTALFINITCLCLGAGALRGGWPGFPRASVARPQQEVSAGCFHPCRALSEVRHAGPKKRGASTIMWTDGLGPEVLLSFLFLFFPLFPLHPSECQRDKGQGGLFFGSVGWAGGRGQEAGGGVGEKVARSTLQFMAMVMFTLLTRVGLGCGSCWHLPLWPPLKTLAFGSASPRALPQQWISHHGPDQPQIPQTQGGHAADPLGSC